MTISKEAFVDLHEKYEKFRKLIDEDSKLDPVSEPYLSKYSARQILIGMKANIENLLRNQTPDTNEHIKLTGMLGTVYLYLGIVSIDTEEISNGKKNLSKCEETIDKYQMKPEIIQITLNMFNQFGILYSQSEPDTSKVYLEKAEFLYKQFKESGDTPFDLSDLFNVNQEATDPVVALKNFEKLHTLTLYYLAQIYGALKDALKSSVYCHITLQRQLESEDYDPIDWALNSATLSQFFMEKNGFKQARHHLAASLYILNKYEAELNQIVAHNEEFDAKMENFKHRSADVARCWAKYGLLLLNNSRERLLKQADDLNCTINTDLSRLELTSDSTVSMDDLQNLFFTSLDLSDYETQITDQFVLTLEDARAVFLNIQNWLNKAQSYYTLNNLASDYIEICQDQSQMYSHLIFFEDNSENQAKLYKRRADLLENVMNEVNSVYYLQYCRQIWFELSQIYYDILDIKVEKLREIEGRPTAQALSKINNLVDKAIQHYNNFLASFKDKMTNEMPKTIPDDFLKPFLQAYFYIGALNSRYITLDKQTQLKHVRASLEAYEKVIEYSEGNDKIQELISTELGICKEMVKLLPIKVVKLQLEIRQQT